MVVPLVQLSERLPDVHLPEKEFGTRSLQEEGHEAQLHEEEEGQQKVG